MPEEFGNPWMVNLVQPSAPEAVGLWPPAPGWYVVAVVVVIVLVWMGWKGIRRWRANAYRREARRLIDRIADRGALDELPALLKRTALAAYPRAEVASLSGNAWLGFLDGTLGTTEFTSGPGRALADMAFAPEGLLNLPEGEKRELIAVSRRWVRGHRKGRV